MVFDNHQFNAEANIWNCIGFILEYIVSNTKLNWMTPTTGEKLTLCKRQKETQKVKIKLQKTKVKTLLTCSCKLSITIKPFENFFFKRK